MTEHEHHRAHHHGAADNHATNPDHSTAVLDLRGLHWASQQNVATSVLRRRPGVVEAEVNPVGQTATVMFDPAVTSVAELRAWVEECGYHCDGQSVPTHVCDPMEEPTHHGHEGHAAMVLALANPGITVIDPCVVADRA